MDLTVGITMFMETTSTHLTLEPAHVIHLDLIQDLLQELFRFPMKNLPFHQTLLLVDYTVRLKIVVAYDSMRDVIGSARGDFNSIFEGRVATDDILYHMCANAAHALSVINVSNLM